MKYKLSWARRKPRTPRKKKKRNRHNGSRQSSRSSSSLDSSSPIERILEEEFLNSWGKSTHTPIFHQIHKQKFKKMDCFLKKSFIFLVVFSCFHILIITCFFFADHNYFFCNVFNFFETRNYFFLRQENEVEKSTSFSKKSKTIIFELLWLQKFKKADIFKFQRCKPYLRTFAAFLWMPTAVLSTYCAWPVFFKTII